MEASRGIWKRMKVPRGCLHGSSHGFRFASKVLTALKCLKRCHYFHPNASIRFHLLPSSVPKREPKLAVFFKFTEHRGEVERARQATTRSITTQKYCSHGSENVSRQLRRREFSRASPYFSTARGIGCWQSRLRHAEATQNAFDCLLRHIFDTPPPHVLI